MGEVSPGPLNLEYPEVPCEPPPLKTVSGPHGLGSWEFPELSSSIRDPSFSLSRGAGIHARQQAGLGWCVDAELLLLLTK